MKPEENKSEDLAPDQTAEMQNKDEHGAAQVPDEEDASVDSTDEASTPSSEAPPKGKGKKKTSPPVEQEKPSLRDIGLAAIAEHGLPLAFVTSDGQVFAQRCDAAAHAQTLADKTLEKVEK